MAKPLIGISACLKDVAGTPHHAVGTKYVAGVAEGAGGLPLLLPVLGTADLEQILDTVDAILLTGSPSNVEPHLYGGLPSRPGTLHDPDRDATTLPLARLAIERGIPLLAICRGHQELNVALGGTLHQLVHELDGRFDHRAKGETKDEQYGPAHRIDIVPGSLLARLTGLDRAIVNSLHSQGIDRLAEALTVEAVAEDGTIEAVRVTMARSFAYGVQWHPEWRHAENPVSTALLTAFGEAARARAAARARSAAA